MTFDVNQTTAFINGLKGKYDGKVEDDSIRYGMNAASNQKEYFTTVVMNDNYNTAPILDLPITEKDAQANEQKLNNFIDENQKYLDSLPPLQFEYRYMPEADMGKVDKKALLGAAYEEMDKRKEIPVTEFENNYLMSKDLTAKPLDINKDGKIDIAEYGTTILAADILSDGTTDVTKADGKINAKGMDAVTEYTKKANATAAEQLYSNLYNTYNLSDSLKDFP